MPGGPYGAYAATYLLALVVFTTVVFALPLFVVPIRWGRLMRFTIPSDTDLAIYFGRCLGAIALALNAVVVRAALTGAGIGVLFDLLIGVSALMVIVHVWGALRGIQPWTETVEIAFWALVLVANLAFHPGTSTTASQLVGNVTAM